MAKRIAGVDEAGRGPLAGPVVAAAVVFDEGYQNSEIRDSKQLSAKKREYLVDVIKKEAREWSIISVGQKRIDQLNIREATRLAMSLSVKRIKADLVLIDGNMKINTNLPQRTIIKGDSLHVEIAAASIIAKVFRDNIMRVLNTKYPGYYLDRHAGYPTAVHKRAIAKLGPSIIHRHTFRGVKEYT